MNAIEGDGTPADRGLYIGASTKMYLGYRASIDWLEQIAAAIASRPGLTAAGVVPFIVPSYPVLESAVRILAPTGATIGAQDVATGHGALTGEVSAGLLVDLGVTLAEVGHAERRRLFGETDAVVAAKVRAATDGGMTPLLCVGELAQGDPDDAVRFVVEQCLAAAGADASRLTDVIIAYEPLWAIGAPAPAPADFVNAVVAGIRAELAALVTTVPSILYGGSAGPGLLRTLPEVDGLFLGRFAHDPVNFAAVLDEALHRVGGNR